MRDYLTTILGGLLQGVKEFQSDADDSPEQTEDDRLHVPFSVLKQRDWALAVTLWLEHAPAILSQLKPRSCPACRNGDHRWLFDSFDAYPFHECLDCGVWFVPLQVDDAAFQEYFARCPEAAALNERVVRNRSDGDLPSLDTNRVRSYLKELEPLVETGNSNTSYLDIGCNVGHSLRAARDLGYEATGIEICPIAIEEARAQGLAVVRPGEVSRDTRFGVVSLWETLEHIADSAQALSDSLSFLAPGGLLALTVPNASAPSVRMLRGDCPWVYGGHLTPGHINLFHEVSLRKALTAAGFFVLDVDGQFGTDWQELISYCLGFHHGAHDYISGRQPRHGLSVRVQEILNAVGPAWSEIERMSLTAPILKVVACRQGEEGRFTQALESVRKQRTSAIAAMTKAHHGYEAEIRRCHRQIEEQEAELDRRTEALTELRKALQAGTLHRIYRRLFGVRTKVHAR